MAKDVADVLGYRNAPDMTRNLDDEDKDAQIVRTLGGNQKTTIINESGLYTAIFHSRRSDAKKFKRHVTSEILPSIRKHGGYIQGQEELTDEEFLAKALLMAHSKLEDEEGESWFVAKDVCEVLDLMDFKTSLRSLDEDEKGVHSMPTPGGNQRMKGSFRIRPLCLDIKIVGENQKP